MLFMGFVNCLMSWYCLKNYFELVFYIIFLTFVVFLVEVMLYVNITDIIKTILRKIIKVNPKKEEKVIDDFFIEGIDDLDDYDIFTPLKDQEA